MGKWVRSLAIPTPDSIWNMKLTAHRVSVTLSFFCELLIIALPLYNWNYSVDGISYFIRLSVLIHNKTCIVRNEVSTSKNMFICQIWGRNESCAYSIRIDERPERWNCAKRKSNRRNAIIKFSIRQTNELNYLYRNMSTHIKM